MRFGGRRGIEALAVLLAILMIVGVVLPLMVRAASFQIRGVVSTCGAPSRPVPRATVTLVDVNGIRPPQTAQTQLDGRYVFTDPPTASYSITVDQPDWFSAASTTPVLFDGTQHVDINVCMDPHGSPPRFLVVTVKDNANRPIPLASVSAFEQSSGRFVTMGPTNNSGQVNLTLWGATFVLRASKATFATLEQTVDVSATQATTIILAPTTSALFGYVKAANGTFLASGVVAWLYNPTAPVNDVHRLIPATVLDSLYVFEASRVPSPASYILIVDADSHLSSREPIAIPAAQPQHNVTLTAARERFETTILYGTVDWSNITIWRNLTLNADSTLPGLGPPNLRDLRRQIDDTLGDRDGILTAAEIPLFETWITNKGPPYVTTAGFFTTNGRAYNRTGGFSSTVSPTLGTPDAQVWINTSATYQVAGAPPYITTGAKSYSVNMTMVADSGVPAYKDHVYLVQVPNGYEMNHSAVDIEPQGAPVSLENFTRFTVDPGVPPLGGSQSPQVKLKVERTLQGTARAKAIGPAGKFHEANTDFKSYQVYVANNTEITYSAATSTHPIQPINKLNFTWRFTPAPTPPSDTRWGMEVKYKFTRNGTFTVNLTMREGSGNFSYRDFTVFVDDTPPVAQIRTDRIPGRSANGATLRVDEEIAVRFNGTFSTDLAFPGKPGAILDSGYAWDFDGNGTTDATGRTVTWTFHMPGVFFVNLTVTDGVGWKGVNATLTARVNDTTAPVPQFDILDSTNEWATITSPMERKTVALNASKTRDEFDPIARLNFTWTIPGPVTVGGTLLTGPTHTFYGVNVTFAWDLWNISYRVVLSVRDTGFRGGGTDAGPPKPNWGNLTRNVSVQLDQAFHADLRVDAIQVSPPDPAEGDAVTISVNVTNKVGWATARNVTVQLLTFSGRDTVLVPATVRWFRGDVDTTDSDRTIAAGTTVKLVLTAQLSGQGNKTIQVFVYDSTEPYTRLTDNKPTKPVNVRQPWWQPWAILGAILAVIILAVFGMYARRKIKAGEWRPIRGRRGERGAEEKEKPRREVKEEKKRL